MTVPFNFATQSGNIPLSELDANFANVSAHTLTATYVTGNNQSNITNVGTLNSLAVYGNVSAGNVSTTGIVRANLVIGVNYTGTNVSVTGNVNAGTNINAVGTVVGNNISANNTVSAAVVSAAVVSATGNVIGGNLVTAGYVTAVGNIIGGNVQTPNLVVNYIYSDDSTYVTVEDGLEVHGGLISETVNVTGNIQAGNLRSTGGISVTGNIYSNTAFRTIGSVSATGNVTGNYFIGNGSQLTDVIAVGVGTLASLSVTGNINSGNLETAGIVSATGNGTFGNINTGGTVSATGNVDINGLLSVVGGLRSSGNIYSVQTFRTGGAVSAVGNVTGGNLITNASGAVITAPTALANLSAISGSRAFINNANLVAVGNFGALVGSGGANVVPVWSDGTNWYIG